MQNCYNAGKIPRENLHDQNAKSKAESLQFIKDLADQNKLLKKRIEELETEHANCAELRTYVEESKEKMKQIQEDHLKQMDEINTMFAEKQKEEMMKLMQEKLDQEDNYKDQITKLKAQISQLEKTNRELLMRIDSMAESEEQGHLIKMELDSVKKRNEKLQDELTLMKEKLKENSDSTNYIAEIEDLKKKNAMLSQDVRAKTQKVVELEFRLDKMEKQLKEYSEENDKISLIENLKIKVTQMQAERTVSTEQLKNNEKLIQELQDEVDKLREALSKCEVAKHRLYIDYKNILEEYNKLREKYASDSQHKTFQDFIQLKRQLNTVKTENDDLKHFARTASGPNLPTLKPLVNLSSKNRGSGSFKKKTLKTLKE